MIFYDFWCFWWFLWLFVISYVVSYFVYFYHFWWFLWYFGHFGVFCDFEFGVMNCIELWVFMIFYDFLWFFVYSYEWFILIGILGLFATSWIWMVYVFGACRFWHARSELDFLAFFEFFIFLSFFGIFVRIHKVLKHDNNIIFRNFGIYIYIYLFMFMIIINYTCRWAWESSRARDDFKPIAKFSVDFINAVIFCERQFPRFARWCIWV